MHNPTLRRPEEFLVVASPSTAARLRGPICAASLLAAQRRVVQPQRKRGAGLGSRCGRDECGAGAPRSRPPHQKERSESLIEIITLIAMVLVAGGVSSRLVEFIKNVRWSGRAKIQVVVKRLLGNHAYPPDK